MFYIAKALSNEALPILGNGVEVKHEDIERRFIDQLEEEGLEEGQDFEIVPIERKKKR